MLRCPRMHSDDPPDSAQPPTRFPPHLRLVWSRPSHLPPLAPRKPVDLAAAIERHLSGRDGYTDEQFVVMFSRARS